MTHALFPAAFKTRAVGPEVRTAIAVPPHDDAAIRCVVAVSDRLEGASLFQRAQACKVLAVRRRERGGGGGSAQQCDVQVAGAGEIGELAAKGGGRRGGFEERQGGRAGGCVVVGAIEGAQGG